MLKLFNTLQSRADFKDTIRDLLVSMKSFACKDDAFYEEERNAALERQKQLDLEKKRAIPGMISPATAQQMNTATSNGFGFNVGN